MRPKDPDIKFLGRFLGISLAGLITTAAGRTRTPLDWVCDTCATCYMYGEQPVAPTMVCKSITGYNCGIIEPMKARILSARRDLPFLFLFSAILWVE